MTAPTIIVGVNSPPRAPPAMHPAVATIFSSGSATSRANPTRASNASWTVSLPLPSSSGTNTDAVPSVASTTTGITTAAMPLSFTPPAQPMARTTATAMTPNTGPASRAHTVTVAESVVPWTV